MDLEFIILGEVRQTKTRELCDITYRWNIKSNTNESIYEIETDSRLLEPAYGCQGEGWWGRGS